MKYPGDDAITWLSENNNKSTKGDSGGPLYHMLPYGRREVVGVLSKQECNLDPLSLSWYRTNLYTGVTNSAPAAWLEQFASLTIHPFSSSSAARNAAIASAPARSLAIPREMVMVPGGPPEDLPV